MREIIELLVARALQVSLDAFLIAWGLSLLGIVPLTVGSILGIVAIKAGLAPWVTFKP